MTFNIWELKLNEIFTDSKPWQILRIGAAWNEMSNECHICHDISEAYITPETCFKTKKRICPKMLQAVKMKSNQNWWQL